MLNTETTPTEFQPLPLRHRSRSRKPLSHASAKRQQAAFHRIWHGGVTSDGRNQPGLPCLPVRVSSPRRLDPDCDPVAPLAKSTTRWHRASRLVTDLRLTRSQQAASKLVGPKRTPAYTKLWHLIGLLPVSVSEFFKRQFSGDRACCSGRHRASERRLCARLWRRRLDPVGRAAPFGDFRAGLMRSRGVFFAIISWCGRSAIVEAATIPTVATLINTTC